jgi:hypothetical protein
MIHHPTAVTIFLLAGCGGDLPLTKIDGKKCYIAIAIAGIIIIIVLSLKTNEKIPGWGENTRNLRR